LLPSYSVFDMGASEAIYSLISHHKIVERVSPIIYMRAQKNKVEREGMRRAHIRDGVAMCDSLSFFEERVSDSCSSSQIKIKSN
jgi:Xaa-Pro aminopeptidase